MTLLNRLFDNVYVGALQVSNYGLLNTIGLDAYISWIVLYFDINNISAYNQFSINYRYGIFPKLSTVVACYSAPNDLGG